MPAACVEQLRRADLILHAGDFVARPTYDELAALGPPLAAVHGNVDSSELCALLPEQRIIDAGGARVGMLHDAGPARRRIERLRRRFPDCDAVVFGHSHIPLHERAPDGFQIFNPGSPTDRRSRPAHTMGLAEARDGRITFDLLTL